ncbi:MAG: hypothetical protein DWP94_03440 [Flavobacterium sp.]|nr:MAG: hypothetical protein DWP94_03440 [Flavobacterium sp.]
MDFLFQKTIQGWIQFPLLRNENWSRMGRTLQGNPNCFAVLDFYFRKPYKAGFNFHCCATKIGPEWGGLYKEIRTASQYWIFISENHRINSWFSEIKNPVSFETGFPRSGSWTRTSDLRVMSGYDRFRQFISV